MVLKRLVRLMSLLGLLIAIVWLTREHLLPAPRVSSEPPPHFRSSPPASSQPDDLTRIKGIGPVYAGRLESAGISSFSTLASADPSAIADGIETSESNVRDWISQAEAHLH